MLQEKTTIIGTDFFKQDSSRYVFSALILAVIGTGIVFRTMGITNSLWLDEAMWAERLVNKPLLHVGLIRPIAFTALVKLLVSIKNNEITLRLISYVASIFAIFLTYLVAKEAFKSKLTIFLAVFLVSFNPMLISFAKEFKPYSHEFLVHLFFVWICVLLAKQKIRLRYYHFIPILLLLSPFAYNLAFLYPSLVLLLLLNSYEKENFKDFFAVLSIASLALAAMAVGYFVFFAPRKTALGESIRLYHARKYDTFSIFSDLFHHAKWILKHYLGLVWTSARAEVFWDLFSVKYDASSRIAFLTNTVEDRVVNVVLSILHLIGLMAYFFRREVKNILIFVLPILVVIIVNAFAIWPFGPFRTNLFLFPYFLFITLYGIDVLTGTSRMRLNSIMSVLIIATLILLQIPFKPAYFKAKIGDNPDIKAVLSTIFDFSSNNKSHNFDKNPRIILAESHSYYSIKYYLENHSEFSRRKEEIPIDYEVVRVKKMREIGEVLGSVSTDYLAKNEPVWIVNSYHLYFKELDNYLVKENILYHKAFNKSELACYLPHTVSNLYTFDHGNGFGGIEGSAEMKIEREERDGKEVLIAAVAGENSCLKLPNINYPKDRFLSISAHVESPAKTDFRLFYLTETEKEYTESKGVTVWIGYGKNTLDAVINEKDIYGNILICPGRVPGEYAFSDIKINALNNKTAD